MLSLTGIRDHASRLIQQYAASKACRARRLPIFPAICAWSAGIFQHGWLLIAEQLTRGVDVGSIEFIHQQLINYRAEGNAILLVSAELSEIMKPSGSHLVMFEGASWENFRRRKRTRPSCYHCGGKRGD
ncbi:MAG: hypothetical protein U0401_12000 [Anaerolineae bacterium]